MKIILINKFFYLKGGSERAFFNQAEILRSRGHRVLFFSMRDERNFPCSESEFFVNNVDYNLPGSLKGDISRSARILYSLEARKKLSRLISRERPQIAHLHNIHHQLSPSIIHALKERGIPVVMTLHDYKMVCPAYTLTRDGMICERCRGRQYYHCFLGRCTKGSRVKSLVNVIEMYLHHSIMRVYHLVDLFIAPSRFLAEKIKEMGFTGNITYLPYPIDTREYDPVYGSADNTICYFGRLSREKGLFTLLEAMKGVDATLKIIGDGPIRPALEAIVKKECLDNIIFLGYRSGPVLKQEIINSLAVIVPSEWYDNYPNVIMESFALGKPVIGAGIGGIPEIVRDNETGLTFKSGDAGDLRSKIQVLLRDRDLVAELGTRARNFVEENLNPEKYYSALIKVYQQAMEESSWKRR